jgi:hypothetical protein
MAAPETLADRAKAAQEAVRAIWAKVLSGQPLTEAEELAWHNHWIDPRECPGRAA